MKIGLFLALLDELPLEDALDTAVAAGCSAVEIRSWPGSGHCDPGALLADEEGKARLVEEVGRRGLSISALSCHGNALHPDREVATLCDAIQLQDADATLARVTDFFLAAVQSPTAAAGSPHHESRHAR